jgi:deferrochelatase/peroxidase EfeB
MSSLDRRRFLTRSAATLGAVGTGAVLLGGQDGADAATGESAPTTPALSDKIPFDGPKQAGILDPPQAHGIVVALDAVAPTSADLSNALEALSYRVRELANGGPVATLAPDDPAPDSGTLGDTISPDGLTVTISFGASLFDDRYGLASKKPAKLTAMPRFAVDEDLDPTRTGGDVLLQICAGQQDTVTHALREIMRLVRGSLELRWVMHGFQSAARGPSPKSSGRNLFAFRDGTANPDVTDGNLMDQLVWASDGEPTWATGGTYQVVRTIRMQVEFWDRVGLREQENMIGRSRATGAPLGGTDEFEDPRLDLDPKGDRIPLDAHIRLANPRTAPTADQKILRRGYNYDRGFDEAGALDQGLIFIAYNQDPARQFATIQGRLNSEPMTDYIRPVGGGYFFVPPGTGTDPRGWIGSGLFT